MAQIETNRTGLASHVADTSNPHQVTKAQVGLGNVDNTSDADKPVSTAQQAALDALKDDIDSLYDPETASGDIVTIEDADSVLVDELVVDIRPVQDLHGYDNPWPAGGNRNMFDESQFLNATGWTKDSNGFYTGNSRELNALYGYSSDGFIPSAKFKPNTQYTCSGIGKVADSVAFMNLIWVYDDDTREAISLPYSTTEAAFTGTSSAGKTVKKVAVGYISNYGTIYLKNVQVEEGTSKTDYIPYSNICPISGWTGAKINVDGVNVWDEVWEVGGLRSDTGADYNTGTAIRSKNYIPITAGKTYYIHCLYDGNKGLYIQGYDSEKNHVGSSWLFQAVVNSSITIPEGVSYLRFTVLGSYGTTYNNDISINYPSTDTSYHSGTSNKSVDVDWTDEGTVYGGTLTYLGSGKYSLQDIYKGVTLTGAEEYTWYKSNTYQGSFYTAVSNFGFAGKTAGGEILACSHLGIATALSNYDIGDCMLSSDGTNINFWFADGATLPDATAFKAYLAAQYSAGTPVQIVAKYANLPDPIILDAEDIELLEGTNNIFADAGPVTVKFAKGALAIALSKLTARINALEAQA